MGWFRPFTFQLVNLINCLVPRQDVFKLALHGDVNDIDVALRLEAYKNSETKTRYSKKKKKNILVPVSNEWRSRVVF